MMNIIIEYVNEYNETVVEPFERLEAHNKKYMINGNYVTKDAWDRAFNQIYSECNKDPSIHYIRT